jgi:hypothetical protein
VDSRNLEAYLLDGTNLGVPARVKMRAWREPNEV